MLFSYQALTVAGALITALATIFLTVATVLLAKATNRLNEISAYLTATQHIAALTHALNMQTQVVLSSDENLMIADALIAQPDIDRSTAKTRERWICFVLLNVQELIFTARTQEKTFNELWDAAEHGVLDHMIKNETVMHLLRTRGYAPEFVKFCEARPEKLLTGA